MKFQRINTRDDLDILRNELIIAEKKVKRLKIGAFFFCLYFIGVTVLYLIKNNMI